ncbi:MAG: hypothetical protein HGA67_02790 [Candidatus Yonathbacteria bacterium]|nr:hypothetical protein [Candidatus Yonathbacteria bacterium]
MDRKTLLGLQKQHLAWLGGNIFNQRVGDFVYTHREANPDWLWFYDEKGNTVLHGGQGCQTDVYVRICKASHELLWPRLLAYLSELVGRHGEELHSEGVHKFHGVTITLPFNNVPEAVRNALTETEVRIHTGSGCTYDQGEIAHEVMAALSDVPVLKAVAPMFHHYSFEREDKGDKIGYFFSEYDMWIFFRDKRDSSFVFIGMVADDKADEFIAEFQRVVHRVLSSWTEYLTGESLPYVFDTEKYPYIYKDRSLSYGQETIEITEHQDALFTYFGINIPYSIPGCYFARVDFVKEMMEALSEAFPVPEEAEVE